MNKTMFLFLLGEFILAATVDAQNPLTNSLVAYYPFNNGSEFDESGYHRSITAGDWYILWDRFANPLSAVGFLDSVQYMYVFGSLHPRDEVTLTYSCWTCCDRTNQLPQCLFNVGTIWNLSGPFVENSRSGILLTGSNLMVVYVGQDNDFCSPQAVLTPGVWQHLVITKQRTAVSIYIDGVLKASGYTKAGQNVTSSLLYIGRNGNDLVNSGEQYHGKLDELRIYNRALSGAEVNQLYNCESVPRMEATQSGQRVRLDMFNLHVGTNYALQSSMDLRTWVDTGMSFSAAPSTNFQYLDITGAASFWRLRKVP